MNLGAGNLAVNLGEQYHTEEIRLSEGALLLFSTDGLLDARRGEEFFGAEQVRSYIKEHSSLPLKDLLEGLVCEARSFSA